MKRGSAESSPSLARRRRMWTVTVLVSVKKGYSQTRRGRGGRRGRRAGRTRAGSARAPRRRGRPGASPAPPAAGRARLVAPPRPPRLAARPAASPPRPGRPARPGRRACLCMNCSDRSDLLAEVAGLASSCGHPRTSFWRQGRGRICDKNGFASEGHNLGNQLATAATPRVKLRRLQEDQHRV